MHGECRQELATWLTDELAAKSCTAACPIGYETQKEPFAFHLGTVFLCLSFEISCRSSSSPPSPGNSAMSRQRQKIIRCLHNLQGRRQNCGEEENAAPAQVLMTRDKILCANCGDSRAVPHCLLDYMQWKAVGMCTGLQMTDHLCCSCMYLYSNPGMSKRHNMTLEGSFSVVSKPNFASSYSF